MGCALMPPSKATSMFQVGREARGLTLEDLAEKVQLTVGRLAEIEATGRAKAGELAGLADVLNYPLHFFLQDVAEYNRTGLGFVCGEGVYVCQVGDCGYVADYLCDYPIGDGRTCSLPICEEHRAHAQCGLDYCPTHAAMGRPAGC